jgi:transcription termination factor Rho
MLSRQTSAVPQVTHVQVAEMVIEKAKRLVEHSRTALRHDSSEARL